MFNFTLGNKLRGYYFNTQMAGRQLLLLLLHFVWSHKRRNFIGLCKLLLQIGISDSARETEKSNKFKNPPAIVSGCLVDVYLPFPESRSGQRNPFICTENNLNRAPDSGSRNELINSVAINRIQAAPLRCKPKASSKIRTEEMSKSSAGEEVEVFCLSVEAFWMDRNWKSL